MITVRRDTAARGPAGDMPKRTALITGAAQGIGRACAAIFSEKGYAVALADKNKDGVLRASQELSSSGPADAFACDVTKKADVDELLNRVVDRFGGLDVLVANAGIVRSGGILDLSEEDFDAVLNCNLRGVFLTGQAACRQMQKQYRASPERRGSIINISSVGSTLGLPEDLAYASSKGGVNNMTRSMAVQMAPMGVRVNAIAPGTTSTDMVQRYLEDLGASKDEVLHSVLSRIPMLRPAKPEEVARMVEVLASDAASYCTGQILHVDGGMTALAYTVSTDAI